MNNNTLPLGCFSRVEVVLQFLEWCLSQHSDPTWRAVRDRFEVSRATAYRRLQLYHQIKDRFEARFELKKVA